MAGKDDFFGDGSGIGDSEDASLDDFFQPAVSESEPPPPQQPEVAPPAPEVPPAPQAPPVPEAPPAPEVTPSHPSMPDAQPFPEEPPDQSSFSIQPPPPDSGPDEQDSLFPMEKGAEMDAYAEEASDDSGVEIVEPDETDKGEGKPGIFSKIPRVAIVILIAVVTAALVGGGGYFVYSKFIATKKDKTPKKTKVVAKAPSPIVPKEVPAVEANQPESVSPSQPLVANPKPEPKSKKAKKATKAKKAKKAKKKPVTPVAAPKKKASPKPRKTAKTVKKVKPYKAKALEGLPPQKQPPRGTWAVHLERLALETTIVKDSQLVKKAGFDPFRIVERKSSQLTEYRLVAYFPSLNDAYSAAWKADEMGYRPNIKKGRKGATVVFVVSFSQNDAENMRGELEKKGLGKVKISKVRNSKRLQSLRVGPFDTEGEALSAAKKLKSGGFPHAMVIRNK